MFAKILNENVCKKFYLVIKFKKIKNFQLLADLCLQLQLQPQPLPRWPSSRERTATCNDDDDDTGTEWLGRQSFAFLSFFLFLDWF